MQLQSVPLDPISHGPTHRVVPGVSLILKLLKVLQPYLLCDKRHLALQNIQEEAPVAYLQLLQLNSSGDFPNKNWNAAHFKKAFAMLNLYRESRRPENLSLQIAA
jgi:hypothetical protein